MLKMATSSARWYFNITKWCPTPQELLHATACIQEEEKTRLGKFVFKEDFKSSLVGRLMMRKYVAEACKMRYNDVRFKRDDKGRPILLENSGDIKVNFNVSHQGDYTLFAGEVDKDNIMLGVDVMKLKYTGGKPISEFFRIMRRNFSSEEWTQIYSSKQENEQLNTFLRLWSLKESYVKAIGVGITVKLDDLSFKVSTPLEVGVVVDDSVLYVKGEKLGEWCFEESLIDDMHCVSVGSNKKIEGSGFREVDFEFLMENSERLLEEDEGYCAQYYKKMDKSF